jgi:hypothetical protein
MIFGFFFSPYKKTLKEEKAKKIIKQKGRREKYTKKTTNSQHRSFSHLHHHKWMQSVE